MSDIRNPLTSEIAAEVPLPRAPLVRVIAQVRFPPVLSVERREFVAPLQEVLRPHYPVLRAEKTQGLLFGPLGASPTETQTVWRFSDATSDWRISLAPDFVAVETTKYTCRRDFFERFCFVVNSVAAHINPGVVDRLGVRYIDRVVGNDVKSISTLVRSEVLGVVSTEMANSLKHALCENVFDVPDSAAQLIARWGMLPKGGTVDPAAIPPSEEPSWILDVDMYTAASMPFDPNKVASTAQQYAERVYTFFRWAVTDEFLRFYGGDV